MAKQESSPSRNSAVKPPHPFYIPNDGPLNYFIDLPIIILLDSDRRSMARRWGLLDGYHIIKPRLYDTVKYPPPGCIAVYDKAFELGKGFPLHPFSREVLDFLNITVSELYPNSWGCLNAFILISRTMGVNPSLTAFRHIFRARLCNSQNNGAGSITFSYKRSFKLVGELPDSQKGFRTKFGYLYNS